MPRRLLWFLPKRRGRSLTSRVVRLVGHVLAFRVVANIPAIQIRNRDSCDGGKGKDTDDPPEPNGKGKG